MEPDDIAALENGNTQNAEIISILGSFKKRVSGVMLILCSFRLNIVNVLIFNLFYLISCDLTNPNLS